MWKDRSTEKVDYRGGFAPGHRFWLMIQWVSCELLGYQVFTRLNIRQCSGHITNQFQVYLLLYTVIFVMYSRIKNVLYTLEWTSTWLYLGTINIRIHQLSAQNFVIFSSVISHLLSVWAQNRSDQFGHENYLWMTIFQTW